MAEIASRISQRPLGGGHRGPVLAVHLLELAGEPASVGGQAMTGSGDRQPDRKRKNRASTAHATVAWCTLPTVRQNGNPGKGRCEHGGISD